MERESPLGNIELRAAYAQVKEEAIDAGNLRLDKKVVQVSEVALEELVLRLRDLALEALGGCGEGHVVLVDADREPFRGDLLCQLHRVSGAA